MLILKCLSTLKNGKVVLAYFLLLLPIECLGLLRQVQNYLTQHINAFILVPNIKTPRKLINIPIHRDKFPNMQLHKKGKCRVGLPAHHAFLSQYPP